MDRTSHRANRTAVKDMRKPAFHDNADYHWAKEQDIDREDSGLDSLKSFDSVMTSGYSSSIEQAMATQFSSMSIASSPVTTQKSNVLPPPEDFSKSDVAEEQCDSGFDCGSIRVESFPERKLPAQTENVENNFLQCFLPDNDGDTYLQLAIIQQRSDLAFGMIQMCGIPQALDIANKERQSALHLSVITNQPQITRCLVAYGADVSCKDQQGNTPLHIACQLGLAAQVEMLTARLSPEEDPGLQQCSLPQNVNERNFLGFTPLHLAVINNHSHIVRVLINELHCDVDINDLKSGRTALHHAIERRNIDITHQILGARPNVDALTYDECSPLHLAAARGLRREVQALVTNGADLYLITRDDCDVFELAEHSFRLYNQLREAEASYKKRLSSLQFDTVMG